MKPPESARNFSVVGASVTTWLTLPRSMRSATSSGVSSAVAGMTPAPNFIAPSMMSQICTQFGSIIMMRSPRFTPWRRKYIATRFERSASSA